MKKRFSDLAKTERVKGFYSEIEKEFFSLPFNEPIKSGCSKDNAANIAGIFRKCAAFHGVKIKIQQLQSDDYYDQLLGWCTYLTIIKLS